MNSNWAFLIFALLLMTLGNVLRSLRWKILLPEEARCNNAQLLIAVCVGGLCNFFIPFRLGEVVRTIYLAYISKTRFSQVLASVVMERVTDVFFFTGVMVLLLVGNGVSFSEIWLFFFISCIGVIFLFTVDSIPLLRRFVYFCASIWNEYICFSIMEFVWTLILYLKEKIVTSKVYILFSCAMWCAYLMAFVCVWKSLDDVTSFSQILYIFHAGVFLDFFTALSGVDNEVSTYAFIVALVPLLFAIIYGLVREKNSWMRIFSAKFKTVLCERNAANIKIPRIFKSYEDYNVFLVSYFGNIANPLVLMRMYALENSVLVKQLHGGSNAVTALVQTGDELVIRKFAYGSEVQKLKLQAQWLKRKTCLPLTTVREEHHGQNWFAYDMRHIPSSSDMYEAFHSSELSKSLEILDQILESLDQYHKLTAGDDATESVLRKYHLSKVVENSKHIISTMDDMLDLNNFRINGITFSIDEWNGILDADKSVSVMLHRATAKIHGDMTIENIIFSPVHDKHWFIIDPNPENIFNSPLLDWAKIFQSLHYSYETANKDINCLLRDNEILFCLPRTFVYEKLYAHLKTYVIDKFGNSFLREILYHEIVHYLRLTPYKFRRSADCGILFFAITCLLVREYNERK